MLIFVKITIGENCIDIKMKRFLSVFLMVVCLFSAMTVACIGTCVNLDYEYKDARDEALYRIESFEKATANLDRSSVLGD